MMVSGRFHIFEPLISVGRQMRGVGSKLNEVRSSQL
jgi:hypothetical protein